MNTILQPVVITLKYLLDLLFEVSQDWVVSIILLTLSVRFVLMFINIKAARQQVIQSRIQPQIQYLREKYLHDKELLTKEIIKVYTRYKINPIKMMGASFIQMPLFIGLYHLFSTYGSTMTSILIPWVATLSQNDSMHIVPFIGSFLSMISFLIPLTPEIVQTQSLRKKMGISILTSVVMLLFMWRLPVAVALYWASNSLFAIIERIFYRTPWGRILLTRGVEMEVS